MLVERGQNLGSIDLTRPPARPLEPAGDRGPRSDPRRLGPEELRNAHAGFGRSSDQARIYVVV
jgi:hypothetical protein